MKSRGFFGIVAAVVVLAAAQGASPAISSKSFVDPTGDAQSGAPDITSVVVGNSGSQISFRVNVANQAKLDPTSGILLLIDADGNPATGAADSLGAEYLFEVSATGY